MANLGTNSKSNVLFSHDFKSLSKSNSSSTEAKKKKKDLPEEVERWLGEDKIILYYNIKNVASTC